MLRTRVQLGCWQGSVLAMARASPCRALIRHQCAYCLLISCALCGALLLQAAAAQQQAKQAEAALEEASKSYKTMLQVRGRGFIGFRA